MALLTDSDVLSAINGNNFTAQQLQDGFAVVLAFAVALEAAATAANTTVSALATSFANRSSISVQMQQLQAQLTGLANTQATQNQSIETQRQTIQTQINMLTSQLASS